MKASTDATARIRSQAATLTDLSPVHEISAFYVFFSFDLAGSTHFKTLEPALWPVVVQKFYELIQDNREKRLDKARLWKYVGDEVLLYKKIGRVQEIYECVPDAYAVLNDTIKRLHETYPKTRQALSVKATVWCARTRYIAPHEIAAGDVDFGATPEGGNRNLIIYPDGQQESPDFLGPDIRPLA